MRLSTAWPPAVETPHQNQSRYKKQPLPHRSQLAKDLFSLLFVQKRYKNFLLITFGFFIPDYGLIMTQVQKQKCLLQEISLYLTHYANL